MSKVYGYTISKEANEETFKKTCEKVERYLPSWSKKNLLTDVDGTLIQPYHKDGRFVEVFNDREIDAVFVDAEIRLDDLFGAPKKIYTRDNSQTAEE